MARLNTIQTNMTAGELSPRLNGRVDIARYQNAVATLENAYPQVHGGGVRRPGKQFIAGTKTDAKRSRLLPFVFSAAQSFTLEFGDGYARFYTNKGQVLSGGLPYEIVSPYLEADLPDLNYSQSGDTMFLFHPNYPIQTLRRLSNTSWLLAPHKMIVEPHDEVGTKPATTATLGATTGTGVAVTSALAAFLPSDAGRPFTSGPGSAVIASYVSATQVTIDISVAFSGTALASGAWTLGESPKTSLTPSVASPEGAAITLTAGGNAFQANAVRNDVGSYVHINGGVVEITSITVPGAAVGIIRTVLAGTGAAPSAYWSLESKIWNSTNGYPRCGTLYDQRLVVGGTVAYPNGVWGTKTGLYNDFTPGDANDSDGFDFRMVSDQQNPVMQIVSIKVLLALTFSTEFSLRGGIEKPLTSANVQVKPETVYGTKNVRPIRVGSEILFVQRSGRKVRALSLNSNSDNFVAPNISLLSEHVTKSGITDMCYSQEPDSVAHFVRNDGQVAVLTIEREQEVIGWGRYVTDGAVESVCSIPYNGLDQVWCIVRRTINGVTRRYVELMEYNEDFENNRQTDASIVGSFSPINIAALSWLGGVITLDASAPHGLSPGGAARISGVTPAAYNGDYTVVTAPSGTQITLAKEANPGIATVLGTVTPLASVWGGFSHLEGKTIDILADGVVFPQAIVTGGNVTLARPVASIEGGLHYDSTIVTLPPEVQLPEGSMQGRPVSISEVVVRFYKTIGGKVEKERIPYRKFGPGVLDKPITPFTGDKQVPILGWQRGRQLTIVQDQPLPFCVLSIIKRVTVGD